MALPGTNYAPASLASSTPTAYTHDGHHDMTMPNHAMSMPMGGGADSHNTAIRQHYTYPPGPPSTTPMAPITTHSTPTPPSSNHGSHPAPIATSDAALSIPRYVDTNPRPTKSPRGSLPSSGPGGTPTSALPHHHHDVMHSAGALSNSSLSEYRYTSFPGPAHVAPGSHSVSGSTPQTPYVQEVRNYYQAGVWPTVPPNESPVSTTAPGHDYAPVQSGHGQPHTQLPPLATQDGRAYSFPAGYGASSPRPVGLVADGLTGSHKSDQGTGHQHHQHQQSQGVYAGEQYGVMGNQYWGNGH